MLSLLAGILLTCTLSVSASSAPRSDASPSPPANLFSPLIAQKVLATANAQSSKPYPQYTTRTDGSWIYFPADGWTSGFFPATLYALNQREHLCPGSTSVGGFYP